MGKSPSSVRGHPDIEALLGDEMLMTVDQTSVYLGVSTSTLNHWRSSGRGPRFVKLDRASRAAVRYRLADLRTYVQSRTFSSVAEAELADAMSKVGASVTDWNLLHPFVCAGPRLLIDSAWADVGTLRDALSNPYTRIRWLQPRKALTLPWTRHERRLSILASYLNSGAGRGQRKAIDFAYWKAIGLLPKSSWGSHPDMSLDALEELSRVDLGPVPTPPARRPRA